VFFRFLHKPNTLTPSTPATKAAFAPPRLSPVPQPWGILHVNREKGAITAINFCAENLRSATPLAARPLKQAKADGQEATETHKFATLN
jgi:hypothetical protein